MTGVKYDVNKMLKVAREIYEERRKERPEIVLHGGEPLLLPNKDLEEFLKFAYRLTGKSSVVTNGLLIDDEKIKIFKRYKATVDVSLDGFPHMNIPRMPPEKTEIVMKNIETLIQEGVTVSVMAVLHKYNANKDDLLKFVTWCKDIGVSGVLFNYCKTEEAKHLELPPETVGDIYIYLVKLQTVMGYYIYPASYFVQNLSGSPVLNDCYMAMCDPFCTERAWSVYGDGSVGNCCITENITPLFNRAKEPSYERYMVLQKIPVSEGGCRGCKYWNYCYGGCPCTADDWRKKDKQCVAFYKVYSYIEENLRNIMGAMGLDYELNTEMKKIEDKPVHRVIYRHKNVRLNGIKKTTVNGITMIEYSDRVEVIYNGKAMLES